MAPRRRRQPGAEPATGLRRLFGIDRSGPPPPVTRRGQPLRPWTLPNLVGYVRLAALPAFLYVALDSGDGRTAVAAALYWAIAASDYLDGFLARATGQYSRMGALLDPVVDRLTVLSGVAVAWHFELLPRWALAVLAVRELVTVALAQLALRRGRDIEVNWLGRVAVWMTMSGLFLALVTGHWITDVIFFIGLVLGLLATYVYVQAARRAPAAAPG